MQLINATIVVEHTETVSHDFGPRFLIAASFAIASYNSCTCFGAGRGPGFANGALIRAFSDVDSFDMSACFSFDIVFLPRVY